MLYIISVFWAFVDSTYSIHLHITIPDEKELIEAMNEMGKSPVNVA